MFERFLVSPLDVKIGSTKVHVPYELGDLNLKVAMRTAVPRNWRAGRNDLLAGDVSPLTATTFSMTEQEIERWGR